jgi:hypothetical protein
MCDLETKKKEVKIMAKKSTKNENETKVVETVVEVKAAKTSTVVVSRTLDNIAAEIELNKNIAGEAIWKIGKLLIEAKDQLTEHGEWEEWVRTNAKLEIRQVQRLMKIAREYPNPTTVSLLGKVKAIKLCVLPSGKRQEFMEAVHRVGDGTIKDVFTMSVEELTGVLRSRTKKRGEKEVQSFTTVVVETTSVDETAASETPTINREDFYERLENMNIYADNILARINVSVDDSCDYDYMIDEVQKLCEDILKRLPQRKSS